MERLCQSPRRQDFVKIPILEYGSQSSNLVVVAFLGGFMATVLSVVFLHRGDIGWHHYQMTICGAVLVVIVAIMNHSRRRKGSKILYKGEKLEHHTVNIREISRN